MVSDSRSTNAVDERPVASAADRIAMDGIVAGVIGAATIAVWFFLIDAVRGQPFYTPSLLGTALFRHADLVSSGGTVPVSGEMVILYTWVHGLVFCVIGGAAAWLLAQAERDPNLGFGVLLLFVVFEFGFLVVAFLFAQPVLRTLTLPAVLLGNLLAAATMAVYFRRRHPRLAILP